MAPFLEGDQLKPLDNVKFVRQDRKIAINDPEEEHREIAIEHGMLAELDEKDHPIVSDAGYLGRKSNSYLVYGSPGTCAIQGNPYEARQETGRIVQTITGVKTDVKP